jgi:hypothetical protein
MSEDKQRAKEQAIAQLSNIRESVQQFRAAREADNLEAEEKAREAITEDALDVQVRTDWHNPSTTEKKPNEYMILLCWGGPSVRITGILDVYLEPDSATIEYQDWFTPWEALPLTTEEEDDVITYAQQFYFGE